MSVFGFYDGAQAQDLGGGVTRRILNYAGGLMMVEVRMSKGARGDTHTHPHEQMTFVASGSFEFTVGDETHTVKAGDTVYMPSNVPHGTLSLEDGSVLIDVFTPIREDFL